MIVDALFENGNVDEIMMTYKKVMQPKEITVHFLNEIIEDCDDDLLYEVTKIFKQLPSFSFAIVNHFCYFIEQIIITIFDDLVQEVDGDLLGLHHFFVSHHNLIHIAIFEQSIHNHVAIVANKGVFVQMTALPGLLSYNFLSFIIDVVDRGSFGFSIFVFEGLEHAGGAEIHLIDGLGLIVSEVELHLSDFSGFCVTNEVVVCLFFSACNAHKHEDIRGNFPDGCHSQLHFVLAFSFAYLLSKFVSL
eukprot:TRINITY_DN1935_c0_g1_i1.p1 TRINITY_DN1935_c0_g1~~TRINITY_DN1935_c0_g1_i1.p1  ORF type:complete len:247 (-),score=31.68 TRINITY_DN1935_c0_g1_i1:603-1343(-)